MSDPITTANSEMTAGTAPPATATPLPPGVEDFSGEIRAGRGGAPPWLRYLPHVAIVIGLLYYVLVRAFDPVNVVFGALLMAWMIYTPIAQKRGWFFIPM